MKNTIIRILVLAISLGALTACAVNQENLAGKINGTRILYSDYIESYRGHYNNFQILNNRAPDAIEKEALKSQTWTDATKHVVLNDYFKNTGFQPPARKYWIPSGLISLFTSCAPPSST